MENARNWRIQKQRYSMIGEMCTSCGTKIFPPRDICPECETPAKTPFQFRRRGEVYSFSTVYYPPDGFGEYAPYIVALINLEEGPMVTAQLTNVEGDEVEIGIPVEMVTRQLHEDGKYDMIIYGYKFCPTLQDKAA